MKSVMRFILTLMAILSCVSHGWSQTPAGTKVRKPQMIDTIKANIYADNMFMLYINGELVAVDSIAFVPHNVISVDILPSYPMTIAVMAKTTSIRRRGWNTQTRISAMPGLSSSLATVREQWRLESEENSLGADRSRHQEPTHRKCYGS